LNIHDVFNRSYITYDEKIYSHLKKDTGFYYNFS
jgi:hypothetical protein